MANAPKASTKHPYLAIEWRVIDSPAYADLSFSARAVLVQMTRQLTKDNNGHLQVTLSYMRRFGFGKNTLTRAIAELISHGMIYRSRSGGYQQGAAQYAVTWLSITKREGVFLAGFKSCAWRDWLPADKKTPPPKKGCSNPQNGERTTPTTPKLGIGGTPKTGNIVLVPCRGSNSSTASNELTSDGDSEAHGDDEESGFTRTHDNQPAEYWDFELGEPRTPQAKVSATRLSADSERG